MSMLKEGLALILLSGVLCQSIGQNKSKKDSSVPSKEKQTSTGKKPGPAILQVHRSGEPQPGTNIRVKNKSIKDSSVPSKEQQKAKGSTQELTKSQVAHPGAPKPATNIHEKDLQNKLPKGSNVPSKEKQKISGSSQDASKVKGGHHGASKAATDFKEKTLPKYLDTSQSSPQRQIVDLHNDLRRAVKPAATNMRKMEWNKEAAANALKWAEHCEYGHSNGSMRAIKTSGCGENIYMSGSIANWTVPIQAWYNEVKSFTYGGLKVPWYTIGHYTQVVWSSTYQLGCAAASCKTFIFAVCHYCPPGNYVGQIERPYEAGKKCASCVKNCDNGLCTKI